MNILQRCMLISVFISQSDSFGLVLTPKGIRGKSLLELQGIKDNCNDSSSMSRRNLLFAAGVATTLVSFDQPAAAKYGEGSTMELPSYIDYLIEKNSDLDSSKVLYKGADRAVLLKRIQEADYRLGDIPALAEKKKWSQIQGILTGPLGTLSQTLNQIATPDSSQAVRDEAKRVKTVLFEIGQAASKKNEADCVAKSKQASHQLESFVKAAFE